jgi:phosphatidate cytidylyltransferase
MTLLASMSESLRQRIVTGVVLALVLLSVLLLLPPWATVALLTALVVMGAWEWSAFLRTPSAAWRAAYVALVALALPVTWRLSATPMGRNLVLIAALAWWVAALLWIVLAPRRVSPWSAALAGLLALVPAWLALVRLRTDSPHGAQWVLFALILVWVADIGAFFFGRHFGRRRLAPEVSPGKTWEGVAGGAAVSMVVAIAGGLWFDVPLHTFLPLCLAVVAFSVVGDLTESLLKRFAGIKDSGTLFPGHGGVMDRIDSVTGAAPVLFLGLTVLGVVS